MGNNIGLQNEPSMKEASSSVSMNTDLYWHKKAANLAKLVLPEPPTPTHNK